MAMRATRRLKGVHSTVAAVGEADHGRLLRTRLPLLAFDLVREHQHRKGIPLCVLSELRISILLVLL